MQATESAIRAVVEEVLSELGKSPKQVNGGQLTGSPMLAPASNPNGIPVVSSGTATSKSKRLPAIAKERPRARFMSQSDLWGKRAYRTINSPPTYRSVKKFVKTVFASNAFGGTVQELSVGF